MQWDDEGFLLSKNKYSENSIIAEFFTAHHGKCSGLIFGATSKKIKNYLQIGNKLYINYNYKSEGKAGYFKVEISKVNTPFYFDNKKKLLCITSAMNLIRLLTAESQGNTQIFKTIENFFVELDCSDWIKKYIFWELKILELIGYNLDLNKIINFEIIQNKKRYYIKTNNIKKYIPNFFIDKKITDVDNLNLVNGLNLIGDYMNKNILAPNNLPYPHGRLDFINLFK